MKTFFKWLGYGLVILILLVAIALVALVTLVSPNRFKPLIAAQVKAATGRDLIIDGNLSWTIYPTLGVKSGHVSLTNPTNFKEKTFAEIDSMTMSVELLPLLDRSVQSKGIVLRGMKLFLIKNADGSTNWTFPQKVSSTSVNEASDHDLAKVSLGIAISAIDIEDAQIHWTDNMANKSAVIDDFEFHAKNINLTKSFPVDSQFDFVSRNPDATGKIKLQTDVSLDLSKQVFNLKNLDLDATVNQLNKKLDITISGDVVADLNQQNLKWSGFKAKINNATLNGDMAVSNLNTVPVATGHVVLDPFDLKDFLKSLNQDVSNIQTLKNVTANVDFSASSQTVVANGKFTAEEVQAAKLKLTKVDGAYQYKDGVFTIAPVKAELYQGNLEGQIQAKLNNATPQYMLQTQFRNVQTEPLLADLRGPNQKLTFQGAANFDMQVTTSGSNKDAMMQNLNGTSHLVFNNGTLKGIDIGYWVDSASALVSRQSTTATNAQQTNFGSLTATTVIAQGVIKNEDLLMDSPRFTTKGKGTIDLVHQNIDYSLQATVKQQTNAVKHFSGLIIPITVKGSLDNPSVRLETGTLLKSIAEQQIQQQKANIQKNVVDQIQKNLGGKLPTNATDALKSLLGN